MTEKCSAKVAAPGGWHTLPCSRKGVNFDQDKWWCKQHTPSVEAARKAAQLVKYKVQWAEEDKLRKQRDHNSLVTTKAVELLGCLQRIATDPELAHGDAPILARCCLNGLGLFDWKPWEEMAQK